jgi:hypothetical protein
MSSSHDFVANAKHDLRHSAFCKVACFLGAVCLFFTLMGSLMLAFRAAELDVLTGWRMWLATDGPMPFPNFTISSTGPFQGVVCFAGFSLVPVVPCASQPNCQVVFASQFIATPPASPVVGPNNVQKSNFTVDCLLEQNNDTDLTVFVGGDRSVYALGQQLGERIGIQVPATSQAWIAVRKEILHPDSGDQVEIWRTSVQYPVPIHHSSETTRISVIVNDFIIQHFQQEDQYTGFMALGDMGGLMMVFFALYRMGMFFVGFVLANDSRSLQSGEAAGQTAAAARAERSPLLASGGDGARQRSSYQSADGDDNASQQL